VLLDNFEGEAVMVLHPYRGQKGSNGAGRSALPSDDFPDIVRRNAQAQDGTFRLFNYLQYHFTGSIDESFRDLDNQEAHLLSFFGPQHTAPPIIVLRAIPGAVGIEAGKI